MIALSAYRNAEQKMAVAAPGCGISWNVLAGIGRIESGHAGGGAVDARGTAVRPIYGPVLDGTLPGNEVITTSSVGGGGVTYARAMGPMQFLPGTWARYASDGDGDGVADPQNLFDATLAAARYLCSGGLNLRDPSQVMAAILRYNNSMAYAQNVLGWASAYATGVVPVDLPPITGTPPPLGDAHDQHPEGLGPGLPLNIMGVPMSDPLAQIPMIDLTQQSQLPSQSPMFPWMTPAAPPQSQTQLPGCTLICIDPQSQPPGAPSRRRLAPAAGISTARGFSAGPAGCPAVGAAGLPPPHQRCATPRPAGRPARWSSPGRTAARPGASAPGSPHRAQAEPALAAERNHTAKNPAENRGAVTLASSVPAAPSALSPTLGGNVQS